MKSLGDVEQRATESSGSSMASGGLRPLQCVPAAIPTFESRGLLSSFYCTGASACEWVAYGDVDRRSARVDIVRLATDAASSIAPRVVNRQCTQTLTDFCFQAVRQSPSQIINSYSYSVDNAKDADAALEAASQAHGGACPDALFLCAGKSRPGFFVEQTEESLTLQMQETYWAQAWSALVRALSRTRYGH